MQEVHGEGHSSEEVHRRIRQEGSCSAAEEYAEDGDRGADGDHVSADFSTGGHEVHGKDVVHVAGPGCPCRVGFGEGGDEEAKGDYEERNVAWKDICGLLHSGEVVVEFGEEHSHVDIHFDEGCIQKGLLVNILFFSVMGATGERWRGG